MGKYRSCVYEVEGAIEVRKAIVYRAHLSVRVVVGIVNISPEKAEVWVCSVKSFLQEGDLIVANIKSLVRAIGGQDITQRKSDSSEPAAYFEDCAVLGDATIDTQQHAPLIPPAKPIFQYL